MTCTVYLTSAHHSHQAVAAAADNFDLVFMPAYSCQCKCMPDSVHATFVFLCVAVNAIERLWKIVKEKLLPKHLKLQLRRGSSHEQMEALVRAELDELTDAELQQVLHSNHSYIRSFLQAP